MRTIVEARDEDAFRSKGDLIEMIIEEKKVN